MTNTINATKGLSFNLDAIQGYVTGVTHGSDGAIDVFAQAAYHYPCESEEFRAQVRYRMVHVKLGAKTDEQPTYGAVHAAEAWEWITEQDFDRIVGMREIRESLGWVAA